MTSITAILSWMIEQCLRPAKHRFMAFRWHNKVAVTSFAVLGIQHVSMSDSWMAMAWKRCTLWVQVANGNSHRLPLTRSTERTSIHASHDLASFLRGRLDVLRNAGTPDEDGEIMNSWAVSQMTIALLDMVDPSGMAYLQNDAKTFIGNYIDGLRQKGTGGWKEYQNDEHVHIPATAWTITCLAALKHPLQEDLQFMLDNQSSAGWWPQYHGVLRPSTYATAWSLLSLMACTKVNAQSELQTSQVQNALRVGRSWLLQSQNEAARWCENPLLAPRVASNSISALALLCVIGSQHGRQTTEDSSLCASWLLKLGELPKPDTIYSTGVVIAPGLPDHTRHLDMPWMLMATDLAGRNSNTLDGLRAALWVNAAIERKDNEIVRSVIGRTWISAETLIALRFMGGYRPPWEG
jgi:hypothetical protein